MSNSAPVLIVGGGPTGLVLALAFIQNGITPRIIQKDLQFRIGQKGAAVMPRTQELYHMLGVIRDLTHNGNRALPLRMYAPGSTNPLKTSELMEYRFETPDCPYMNVLNIGQDCHEAILRSHLEKLGCVVELGTELKTFKQYPDYVEVELLKRHQSEGEDTLETARFDWMIGADGGHSIVRHQLGLTFLGETREDTHIIVGDIHIKKGMSRDFWHVWGEYSKKMFSLRPFEIRDDDRYSFMAAGQIDHSKVASSREEYIQAFYEATGRTDVEFGDLIWISDFRPNIRMVNRFGIDRVFVGGDAAHCHSPTGGQGMNSSIQDSVNLAWKLALVHKRLAPRSILESYTQERLPVIAAMLSKTTSLLNSSYEEGMQGWGRGAELRELGVNYRASPIIVDESPSASPTEVIDPYKSGGSGPGIRAGDRAPDAPAIISVHGAGGQRLFDIFKSNQHTVLVFDQSAALQNEVTDAVKGYPAGTIVTVAIIPAGSTFELSARSPDCIFQDLRGYAYKHYKTEEELKIVIVRPDMVVGAVVRGAEGVKKYFGGILLS